MYGAMTWPLFSQKAQQVFNCWSTCVKLAWGVPKATHTYLVWGLAFLLCIASSFKVSGWVAVWQSELWQISVQKTSEAKLGPTWSTLRRRYSWILLGTHWQRSRLPCWVSRLLSQWRILGELDACRSFLLRSTYWKPGNGTLCTWRSWSTPSASPRHTSSWMSQTLPLWTMVCILYWWWSLFFTFTDLFWFC